MDRNAKSSFDDVWLNSLAIHKKYQEAVYDCEYL